jgi:hypothetical protein
MPFGPGTYGVGGGLAASTLGRQGIPAPLDTGAPVEEEALSEIMMMLRGGQFGAERFLQLLNLLAQSTIPGMGGEAPNEAAGPGGPSAAPSIQGLLG